MPRGLAASWRGCSACSQRGRDHSVAVGSSALSQELVTVGIRRQQSRCPAWQSGTLPTGPSGILGWILAETSLGIFPAGRMAIGEPAFGWQSEEGLRG